MKKVNLTKIALVVVLGLVFLTSNVKSQNYPSIKIGGNEILVSDISKFPYWLNAGQTIEIGSNTKFISILQYDEVTAISGGKDLVYDGVIYVTIQQSVPLGKVWKVESVGLDMAAVAAGNTGPTGPAGANGVTGPTGPMGPTGNTGCFTHKIGEEKDGGIIFYLYIGLDGLEHGLIVSKNEQDLKWQNTGVLVNANRSWDGVYNTNLITDSPAKNYVQSLGAGWYLPSIDELIILWHSRFHVNNALYSGGYTLLTGANYWSSSEYDVTHPWRIYFTTGEVAKDNDKSAAYTTRGIRAF